MESISLEPVHFSRELLIVSPDDLNIYGQANLEKLNNSSIETEKPELIVNFDLNGEMRGEVFCQLSPSNKKKEDTSFKEALFIESMNILLGNILTNLELKFGRKVQISAPKIPTNKNLSIQNKPSISYLFTSFQEEQICRIYFLV